MNDSVDLSHFRITFVSRPVDRKKAFLSSLQSVLRGAEPALSPRSYPSIVSTRWFFYATMTQAISFSTFWDSTDRHPPCPQLVACKIFAKSYIHAPSWETVGKDQPDDDRTRVFKVEDRYDSHVLTACDHGMVSEIESCLCFVRTSTRLHLVRSHHSRCGPTYHRSPSYTLTIVGRQSIYQAGGPLAQAASRSICTCESSYSLGLR